MTFERRGIVARERDDAERARRHREEPAERGEAEPQRNRKRIELRRTEPPGRRIASGETAEMSTTRDIAPEERIDDAELDCDGDEKDAARQSPVAGERRGIVELEGEDRARESRHQSRGPDHLAMPRDENARDGADATEDQHDGRPPRAERPFDQGPQDEETGDVDREMDGEPAQSGNPGLDSARTRPAGREGNAP